MKRILIMIMLTIGLEHVSKPQGYEYIPFPTTGAIWSELYSPGDDWPIYERFAVNDEDTLINGLLYTKLYMFFGQELNPTNSTCIGGIREDSSRRIYYSGEIIHSHKPLHFEEGEEILLYDFSTSVGDTIIFGDSTYPLDIIIVSSIDTIEFGGGNRRRYKFRLPSSELEWLTEWVEGVGNLNGLLFPSGDKPISVGSRLICFMLDDEILYLHPSDDECMPQPNSVNSARGLNAEVKIFPNPSGSGNLTFDFNSMRPETLLVFSSAGALIESLSIRGRGQATLSVQSYPPGVYLFAAISKQGRKYTGSFVVK